MPVDKCAIIGLHLVTYLMNRFDLWTPAIIGQTSRDHHCHGDPRAVTRVVAH